MTPRTITLRTPTQRQLVASYAMEAPEGTVVTFRESTRSLEQNAALWAKLSDISRQVIWYGKRLSAEDWKTVLTASLRQTRVVPTIDGDGFVPLGMSTSKMSVKEMGALLDLCDAFAAERGVVWSAGAGVEEMRR